MALPPIPELAVFMILVLVLSLYGLIVSGHFPEEYRAASLRTVTGQILLWGTIALCAGLTVCALAFAWLHVPLYAAVIGGGFMVLIAPLLLQPLPDSFVNGRWALLMFTGLGIGLGLTTVTLFA
jgi:asparagine N-glycosylation enzyme membrane subunit Stt3